MNGKTTQQVADELGIEESTIRSTLHRHAALRPAIRHGWGYVWTETAINALSDYYSKRKAKGGRPKG